MNAPALDMIIVPGGGGTRDLNGTKVSEVASGFQNCHAICEFWTHDGLGLCRLCIVKMG
jgi:hypothetical protein